MESKYKDFEKFITVYYNRKVFELSKNVNIVRDNFKVQYDWYFKNNIDINKQCIVYQIPQDKGKPRFWIDIDFEYKITPLTWAIIDNNLTLVKLLIEYCNAQVDIITTTTDTNTDFLHYNQQTSLYIAMTDNTHPIKEKLQLMKYLIGVGSDIHSGYDLQNDTCLKYCVRSFKVHEIFDYIIDLNKNNQLNVYKRDENGETVAQYAIYENYYFLKYYNSNTMANFLKEGYYLGMFIDFSHQICIFTNGKLDECFDKFCDFIENIKPRTMSKLDFTSLTFAYELALIFLEKSDNINTCKKLIQATTTTEVILPSNDIINFQYHNRLVDILKTEENHHHPPNDPLLINDLFICERVCLSSTKYKYSQIFMDRLIKVFRTNQSKYIELLFLGLDICISENINADYIVKLLSIIYNHNSDDIRWKLLKLMTNTYMEKVKHNDDDLIFYIYALLLIKSIPQIKQDESSSSSHIKFNICRLFKNFRRSSNGNTLAHYLVSKKWMRVNNHRHHLLKNDYPIINNEDIKLIFDFFFIDCQIDLKLLVNNKGFNIRDYASSSYDDVVLTDMLVKNYNF